MFGFQSAAQRFPKNSIKFALSGFGKGRKDVGAEWACDGFGMCRRGPAGGGVEADRQGGRLNRWKGLTATIQREVQPMKTRLLVGREIKSCRGWMAKAVCCGLGWVRICLGNGNDRVVGPRARGGFRVPKAE